MMKKQLAKYDLPRLQSHWETINVGFVREYSDWVNIFSDIIATVCDVAIEFEGKRKLQENCCYLLLTKALNHCFASYCLLERGLLIDAALSSRNALETLLMLELFVKDESSNHFEAWANGKEYKPAYVRNRLRQLPSVAVRDVIIEVDDAHYDDLQFTYDWLSKITHPNVGSSSYIVDGFAGAYQVFVGGNIAGMGAFINAVFTVMCHSLLNTSMICVAIYDLPFLESSKERFGSLTKRINEISRKHIGFGKE